MVRRYFQTAFCFLRGRSGGDGNTTRNGGYDFWEKDLAGDTRIWMTCLDCAKGFGGEVLREMVAAAENWRYSTMQALSWLRLVRHVSVRNSSPPKCRKLWNSWSAPHPCQPQSVPSRVRLGCQTKGCARTQRRRDAPCAGRADPAPDNRSGECLQRFPHRRFRVNYQFNNSAQRSRD